MDTFKKLHSHLEPSSKEEFNVKDGTRAKTPNGDIPTVLCFCAAIRFFGGGSIWDTTPEDYDRIMNVNTRAPFFLMQDAARIMEREKVAGSIINKEV